MALSLCCRVTCGSVATNINALPLSGLPHIPVPLCGRCGVWCGTGNQTSLNHPVLTVPCPPSVALSVPLLPGHLWFGCYQHQCPTTLWSPPHPCAFVWSLWRVVRHWQPNQSQSPSPNGAASAIGGSVRPSVAGSLVVRLLPTSMPYHSLVSPTSPCLCVVVVACGAALATKPVSITQS